ncbi:MAG: ornithine carbamoyltransferase [Dehalococcoidia bacterium]|jgi:ornithine carbamoyltransferase|nr:ornithine carbamoyltransferase [Chloroflexota bacterium]MCK4242253.1 ornithine carbamoyltransferase [Dehalococcoidia bacterium]
MIGKNLLSIADLESGDIQGLIDSAIKLKQGGPKNLLEGKILALIFEKPSLRTRVSFDVAMKQLGGDAIYLSQAEVGLGQREPISDVARVLSRYVDGIVARTFAHSSVELLAKYASIPVINGLSDEEHPCQVLSDLLTIYEKKGRLEGLTLTYIGDANNVANSLLLATSIMGIDFRIASPKGYEPKGKILAQARKTHFTQDPKIAVENADVVYTDVWTSMGQEAEAEKRKAAFSSYQVDRELLALAKKDAIFMHPLPAHHGEEIAEGLLDLPQSVVFDQAENRLHMQKAILVKLMGA